jgi:hypothetical protein
VRFKYPAELPPLNGNLGYATPTAASVEKPEGNKIRFQLWGRRKLESKAAKRGWNEERILAAARLTP